MYIHMYCIYIYMYVCIYIYMCIYIYIYTIKFTNPHTPAKSEIFCAQRFLIPLDFRSCFHVFPFSVFDCSILRICLTGLSPKGDVRMLTLEVLVSPERDEHVVVELPSGTVQTWKIFANGASSFGRPFAQHLWVPGQLQHRRIHGLWLR